MKQLLAEKYRPKTVAEYLFQNQETERTVKKWVKEKEIPNVLMICPQGQGKTSLARVLMNEIGVNPSDIKVVKASLTNGIGFIREELEPWIRKSSMGKFKVVHLEEADRLSAAAQDALRIITEDYSDHVRFIFTANYMSKVSKPLISRFQVLDLNGIDDEQILGLVVDIVEKEELFLHNDDEEIIIAHITKHTPDIRKILNSIDECISVDDNGLKTLHMPKDTSKGAEGEDAWLEAWNAEEVDPVALLELSTAVDNTNFDNFYRVMYENSHKLPDQCKGVVLISKYLDRAQTTANQNLTLDACIYELFFVE